MVAMVVSILYCTRAVDRILVGSRGRQAVPDLHFGIRSMIIWSSRVSNVHNNTARENRVGTPLEGKSYTTSPSIGHGRLYTWT